MQFNPRSCLVPDLHVILTEPSFSSSSSSSLQNTMSHPQDQLHASSLKDPESFWAEQADHLHWHKKPSTILRRYTKTLPKSQKTHDHWEWFPDGEISTCYNCVDRHVEAGHGDSPAILYDSPVTGTKQRITYAELLDDVEALAAVLRAEGVGRGDTVLVYSISPFICI